MKNAYHHLLRVLGERTGCAFTGPQQLWINPTALSCNNRCPICAIQKLPDQERRARMRAETRSWMRERDFMKIFATMPAGVRHVAVCGGGEPFMHPDCMALLRLVKKHNLTGHMITNGTLMGKEIINELIRMRWDSVRISANAGDSDTYRAVSGTDRFDVLRNNLEYLSRRRSEGASPGFPGLTLFFVLQRGNINTIGAMASFAADAGADFAQFEPVMPLDSQDAVDRDEMIMHVSRAAEECKRFTVPTNLENVLASLRNRSDGLRPLRIFGTGAGGAEPPPAAGAAGPPGDMTGMECVAGLHQALIKSSGDVIPCCVSNEVMGNVMETGFADIWFGARFANFRRRLFKGNFPSYCRNAASCCDGSLFRPRRGFFRRKPDRQGARSRHRSKKSNVAST